MRTRTHGGQPDPGSAKPQSPRAARRSPAASGSRARGSKPRRDLHPCVVCARTSRPLAAPRQPSCHADRADHRPYTHRVEGDVTRVDRRRAAALRCVLRRRRVRSGPPRRPGSGAFAARPRRGLSCRSARGISARSGSTSAGHAPCDPRARGRRTCTSRRSRPRLAPSAQAREAEQASEARLPSCPASSRMLPCRPSRICLFSQAFRPCLACPPCPCVPSTRAWRRGGRRGYPPPVCSAFSASSSSWSVLLAPWSP